MAVSQTSSADDRRVVAKDDLLDEYLQRTVAGDTIAFRSLYDLLAPYVRDSAACLFGPGDEVNTITDSVFVDVWRLAGRYQPGGEGVRAWVLKVAGSHTMSRYRPDTGGPDARHGQRHP